MNILYSIRKPYTKMIFQGIKPLEFRNSLPDHFCRWGGETIYIYECKANGGAGQVVGEAKAECVLWLPKRPTSATSFLLPIYASIFCDKETQKQIESLTAEQLKMDPAIVLDTLYEQKLLEPKFQQIYEDCSQWGKQIGACDENRQPLWKHAIQLTDIKEYDQPKQLSDFTGLNGRLQTAPQSFCYVINERNE